MKKDEMIKKWEMIHVKLNASNSTLMRINPLDIDARNLAEVLDALFKQLLADLRGLSQSELSDEQIRQISHLYILAKGTEIQTDNERKVAMDAYLSGVKMIQAGLYTGKE